MFSNDFSSPAIPAGGAWIKKGAAKARPLQNLRRRLQVRAESQQTAIAILHHELPLVPWHVAKAPSEFHALGGVPGIQCVGIFNITKQELG